MRPLRIELDGFSAFRHATTVDFTDVDLFAFVGPTGAGKSSVIDAMIFALYGSVPRYGSERLVHPVITQGKPEARVRLLFEVGGRRYTAVRVVRRTKTGATTKEARLERGDEVLAGDAAAVTTAVISLLGLDLEQFTKCVVLPQGAFAALLHDTTSKRQDLLVKLLDLGVYEQVAVAARRRCQAADARLAVLDEQLGELAGATDAAVERAAAHIARVAAVVERLDAATPEIAALDEKLAGLARHQDELRTRAATLETIVVPTGVSTVAVRVREAAQSLAEATEHEKRAAAEAERARADRQPLGDPARLQTLLAAHEDVRVLDTRVARGRALIADREAELVPLRTARDEAVTAEEAAAATVARAQRDDSAAAVARHLHIGDDCPVCGGTVDVLPDVDAGALDAAARAHRRSVDARQASERAVADAEGGLSALRNALDERLDELDSAGKAVSGAPAPDEVRSLLAAVAEADERVERAVAADGAARRATAAARSTHDTATRDEAAERVRFTVQRDAVAGLGPPSAGDDIAESWRVLADWATTLSSDTSAQLAGILDEHAQLTRRRHDEVAALVDAARAAGIAVADPASLRDACVAARADARSVHAHLVEQRERAVARRAERVDVADDRAVHELLAAELGPKRFEAWLLDEALHSLVAGATERLEQLSSGRYAMAVDARKQFEVIDHANADERRLARTLSGGETFLASLALALALAERVSELSSVGHASLDAIFLDEGFGTLDPETLDVVATAIEELGASGRMVGVVSHVRELAERVPVRFEVHRGPETSTIERIDT